MPSHNKRPAKFFIGLDEVGRGALAGPVLVAAVAISTNLLLNLKNLPPLKDSKKLSESQREKWFSFIKAHPGIFVAASRVNPARVDKINISKAANLAAYKSVSKLLKKPEIKKVKSITLDGGLFIKNRDFQNRNFLKNPPAKTLPKADNLYSEVMLASIFAKVTRDRYMKKLHKKFPAYEFSAHKGYGTKLHKEKITLCGLSPAHRQTFCKFLKINSSPNLS